MSADSFYVCFGLRYEVDADNEDVISLLEQRRDQRQLAARKFGLDCWWGSTMDETRFFALIGTLIGGFGWENNHSKSLTETEMLILMEETKQKLQLAGFNDIPVWHFQFESDY